MFRCLVLLAGLSLTACGGRALPNTASPGAYADLECVPYARAASGIALYGDAASWWDSAAGRYRRGPVPMPGAVLVFRRSARLPYGHVSVVASLSSAREIRVSQANWVHHRIAHDEPVIDVSPDNDWTAVRVWWQPAAQLGATVYPAYGFVGPAHAAPAGAGSDRVSDAAAALIADAR